MVEFALRWSAYGCGPADEIEHRFGMSSAEYFRRLTEHLDGNPSMPLRPEAVEAMKAVARKRL
jgi:hypothetical protein